MIVISPLLADLMRPVFDGMYNILHLDPSLLPAMLFANDMGGAPLATEVARDEAIGGFNALIVSSMMGATISFTIPFSLQVVKKEHHRQLALGLLCGVVTMPIGCFVAGLVCRIPLGALCIDLLPLIILSAVIATGLLLFPNACVKVFSVFGFLIKTLIIVGLLLGMVNFLAKEPLIKGLATVEDGAIICINAAVVLAGMFPLVHIVSRLLKRPIGALGKSLDIK